MNIAVGLDRHYLPDMPAQAHLFPSGAELALPRGMKYRPGLISPNEESALASYIAELPLKPFEFAGGFKGNRRVVSFGWKYDYGQQRLVEASAIPEELRTVRTAAAEFAGHASDDLVQALVTEYAPGAGIGWHRDKRMFDDIIGISLLAPCNFRLRLREGDRWKRMSLRAEPRSAYLLSGSARSEWEHSIPPMDRLRYSITFRSMAASPVRL